MGIKQIKAIQKVLPFPLKVLDVAFREDDCRLRTDDAAENFSILRRLALNLLKQDTTTQLGVKNRRPKAAWIQTTLEKFWGFMRKP